MFDVKKMIEEIAAKKEIKNVSFVGCGGSLACFFAPHYYVTHEAKTLTTLYENANEFTNDTPAFINESLYVLAVEVILHKLLKQLKKQKNVVLQ